jgi:uridine kinase
MQILFLIFLLCAAPLMADPKMIIGIAGGTGSGKSTMSSKLLDTFSERAVMISQDDYYKDLSHLPLEERSKRNFDHPDSIDFDLLKKHIILLKEDRSIEVPVYNFCDCTRENRIRTVKPAEIIIVEGILLFAVPEIRDLCDLKIFVETDDDIRLLRRMERDMNHRSRDFKSIRDQYLTTVKPMHEAFVEPSKRYADVIIPTLKRNDNGVALIISSLRNDMEFLTQKEQAKKPVPQ